MFRLEKTLGYSSIQLILEPSTPDTLCCDSCGKSPALHGSFFHPVSLTGASWSCSFIFQWDCSRTTHVCPHPATKADAQFPVGTSQGHALPRSLFPAGNEAQSPSLKQLMGPEPEIGSRKTHQVLSLRPINGRCA